MHHRRRQNDRLVERPLAALLGATALVALTAVLVAPDVGAAVESIGVSPGSGPPGSHVTVSGSDCAPGLVGGTASNHVALFSGTLQVQLTIPVSSSGSWSTSFTIPSGAPAGPVRIAPVCVSSGFSLTTVYTPGTFVVTAASPTTAPPTTTPPTTRGTTGTTHTTSSTTKAGSKGGGGSASGSTLGSGAGATTGGSTSGRTGGSRAANGAHGSDGVISAIGTITGDPENGRAAGLRSPELASKSSGSPGGLSWWWWLVLATVVALGIGAWLWARRRHRAALVPPAEETVEPPGDDDPEPDDWLEQSYVDDIPTTTR